MMSGVVKAPARVHELAVIYGNVTGRCGAEKSESDVVPGDSSGSVRFKKGIEKKDQKQDERKVQGTLDLGGKKPKGSRIDLEDGKGYGDEGYDFIEDAGQFSVR